MYVCLLPAVEEVRTYFYKKIASSIPGEEDYLIAHGFESYQSCMHTFNNLSTNRKRSVKIKDDCAKLD